MVVAAAAAGTAGACVTVGVPAAQRDADAEAHRVAVHDDVGKVGDTNLRGGQIHREVLVELGIGEVHAVRAHIVHVHSGCGRSVAGAHLLEVTGVRGDLGVRGGHALGGQGVLPVARGLERHVTAADGHAVGRSDLLGGGLLLLHGQGHGVVGGEGAQVAVELVNAALFQHHLAVLIALNLRDGDVIPRQALVDDDGLGICKGIEQVALVVGGPGVGRAVLIEGGRTGVAAQRHIHHGPGRGPSTVHHVVVGGAEHFPVLANLGLAADDVAVGLLLLGEQLIAGSLGDGADKSGQHLGHSTGVGALIGDQAAGVHGVVHLHEVLGVCAVLQPDRLEVQLIVVHARIQEAQADISIAHDEVAGVGVVVSVNHAVAVGVQEELHLGDGGGHDADGAEVRGVVIVEGHVGGGKVGHVEPDLLVAAVGAAVVDDLVLRRQVEVDPLDVGQIRLGEHRAALCEAGILGQGAFLLLVGNGGTAGLLIRVAVGDTAGALPEVADSTRDLAAVDVGGGIAVLIGQPGHGGAQVQNQVLLAGHDHVDGVVAAVDLFVGHAVPQQLNVVCIAAVGDVCRHHLAVSGQVDSIAEAAVRSGRGIAGGVLKGHLQGGAHKELAV